MSGKGEGGSAQSQPCGAPESAAPEATRSTVASIFTDALEMAALLCEQVQAGFLAPEYAVGQPLSSFPERYACSVCAQAIREAARSALGASPADRPPQAQDAPNPPPTPEKTDV